MEEKNYRTIYLGDKYSWTDVDNKISKSNFKSSSSYVSYLVERDLDGFNMPFKDIFLIVSLLLILGLTILILVVIL